MAVEDGRIQEVGKGPTPGSVELGRVAVLPALVNAHTHLELSYLRGAVPACRSLVDWVRQLLALRGANGSDTDSRAQAVSLAIREARLSGTGLVRNNFV